MDNAPSASAETMVFAKLRKLGLRPTSARVCVLQVLNAHVPEPLPAERIFMSLAEMGISVSLGSIYRVLNELAHCGAVLRERGLDATGKAYFLLAQEAGGQAACQLRCTCCERSVTATDKPFLDALQRQLRAGGFDSSTATLSISVTCTSCLAQSSL
jgi:Fur family ferric uptake transcriptional regulator